MEVDGNWRLASRHGLVLLGAAENRHVRHGLVCFGFGNMGPQVKEKTIDLQASANFQVTITGDDDDMPRDSADAEGAGESNT